jgi:hypothetical protein
LAFVALYVIDIPGGEEAFLLGAHAFREQSRFKDDVAVVINL